MISIKNEKFCDINSYHNKTGNANTSKQLKLMEINAQSCANFKTFDEIRNFVDECKNQIDIIVICETWFRQTECDIYTICGYYGVHSC